MNFSRIKLPKCTRSLKYVREEALRYAVLTILQKTFTPKQWAAEKAKKEAEEEKVLKEKAAESDPPASATA